MALLIEHYNGKYPFWLNPRQAIILTVNDEPEVVGYAENVRRAIMRDTPRPWIRAPLEPPYAKASASKHDPLRTPDGLPWAAKSPDDFVIDLDDSPRSIGKKISEAKRKRYGAIIVVGKQNVAENNVTVDLSGIPDPHCYIGTMSTVRTAAAYAQIAEFKTDKERIEQTFDQVHSTRLGPKDLRDLVFLDWNLRETFRQMVNAYV